MIPHSSLPTPQCTNDQRLPLIITTISTSTEATFTIRSVSGLRMGSYRLNYMFFVISKHILMSPKDTPVIFHCFLLTSCYWPALFFILYPCLHHSSPDSQSPGEIYLRQLFSCTFIHLLILASFQVSSSQPVPHGLQPPQPLLVLSSLLTPSFPPWAIFLLAPPGYLVSSNPSWSVIALHLQWTSWLIALLCESMHPWQWQLGVRNRMFVYGG